MNDLSRYNSYDRRLRSIHLSRILITCVDRWSVGREFTASTRSFHRAIDSMHWMLPHVLQSNETKGHSPTRRKRWRVAHLKRRADVTVSVNPKYRMLICTIIILLRVYINKWHVTSVPRRHLARVRLALPRGIACHVASTCTRAKITPLLSFI